MRPGAQASILLAAAGLLAATFTTAARQSRAPAPAATAGTYVGPGGCSAVACHGSLRPVAGSRVLQTEYSTWISQDLHARATTVLSNALSQRMGRILRIDHPETATKCLACHALDVPASDRARTFTDEGVSCEACHGPAAGWLGYHVTRDARHEESVRRGMYDTRDIVKRTEKCLTCHLGTAEKSVDHEMIAAGHPDLVFQLDTFSAAMPRHWRDPAATDPASGVRTFAIGELVHLRAALDRLDRRIKGPAWPEYAELDCFSCHHSLTRPEDSWRQERGYTDRARPGLPPLNVSSYAAASRVLQAYDSQAGSELEALMRRLDIAANQTHASQADLSVLVEHTRAVVNHGIALAVAAPASPETAASILRGLFADTAQIAARGERSAEQAAMAIETLAPLASPDAVSRGEGRSPIFDEVFQQFVSPSAYDPRKFTAAMKTLEATLSK